MAWREARRRRTRSRRVDMRSPFLGDPSYGNDELLAGYDSDSAAELRQFQSRTIGQTIIPKERLEEDNLLNVAREQREIINDISLKALKAKNIACVFAVLLCVVFFLLVISNVIWWLSYENLDDRSKNNEYDLLVLNDTLNDIASGISVVNHNLLFGLGVDSHTQYALVTGRPTTEFTAHEGDATIHFTEDTIDLTSLGTGEPITPGDRDVKSLVEGPGVSISSTGTEITIEANFSGVADGIELISIGTGEPIATGGLYVKSIKAGDDINVTCVANDTLLIDSLAALNQLGGGEAITPGALDVKSLTSVNGSIDFLTSGTEINLEVDTSALNLELNNLGAGEFLSPSGIDVKSITSSTLLITSSATEINLEIDEASVTGGITLNDVSTGEPIKGLLGNLDVKGIKAGGSGAITLFSSATDVIIDVDESNIDLGSTGSGFDLNAGGLDIKSLVSGLGMDISSSATEILFEVGLEIITPNATESVEVLTENLLSAVSTLTLELTTVGGTVTPTTVTSLCPDIGDWAVGCNCDRTLNSGDPPLIMFKGSSVFHNATTDSCTCEYETAHANGASVTFSAQAVCLRLFT